MQALRHTLLSIATFLCLTFFTKCNHSVDRDIKNTALNLADNIDGNSISLLKKFCFGKRGSLEFWQRVSSGSFLYSFSCKQFGDTSELTLFRPFNFAKDFTTNYQFDTSHYYQFKFSKLNDSIVQIGASTSCD